LPTGYQNVILLQQWDNIGKNMKDEYRINIRSNPTEKAQLKKVATKIGVPQSVIIRDAITEKIAELTARIERGEKITVGLK
jgi:predicted DNA-binding protein